MEGAREDSSILLFLKKGMASKYLKTGVNDNLLANNPVSMTPGTPRNCIIGGDPTQIVITAAAQTVIAGEASSSVTVQALDADGNISLSSIMVYLSSTSDTML